MHPDFISGVYNYCDRWCETCPFTFRCSVYVMGNMEEMIRCLPPESESGGFDECTCDDSGNREPFEDEWEDTDSDDCEFSMEDVRAESERIRAAVDNNDAVLLAEDYVKKAQQWFDSEGSTLEKEVGQLMHRPPLGIPGQAPLVEAQELGARLELLQRYYLMIKVKIQRAVSSDIGDVPEPIKDMPRDADGSAKVALIAIDRSVDAWIWLRDYLTESGDNILDILMVLGRLREAVEADFPKARAFVRPGFDTAGESEAKQ